MRLAFVILPIDGCTSLTKPNSYPSLLTFIGGTINLKQILAQWPEILRLASSIENWQATRDKTAWQWRCENALIATNPLSFGDSDNARKGLFPARGPIRRGISVEAFA